jgi:hypothetical protein
MSFVRLVGHAWEAYTRNFKLLAFFSIPFLIAFPLALLLPNFTALSAIFLRFGSISKDLSAGEALLVVGVFVVSMLLFSFALAAINLVVRSQRALTRLTHRDLESIESHTLTLFLLVLVAFAITLMANLLLYDYQLHTTWGALAAFLAALAVVFAPQAVVIDDVGLRHAVELSWRAVVHKLPYFIGFLVLASVLFLLVTGVFLALEGSLPYARLLALVVNSVFVIPFLEVLKTQIYLSKYTLL